METHELLITILSSSLLASILGPLFLEIYRSYSKKVERKFLQMEERFFSLLTTLSAFRVEYIDPKKIEEFNEAYRQIWLYAPDEAIIAINKFFEALGAKKEDLTYADHKAVEMVLELRKQYYGKTNLQPENFMIISPAKSKKV